MFGVVFNKDITLTDTISNEGRYQENSTTSKDTLTMSESGMTIPIWKAPTGSKFPKLETFKLTEDMVKSRAKNNVIIVTFGNYAFMDFILNWVKHLTDLHVFNLLVGNHFTFLNLLCIFFFLFPQLYSCIVIKDSLICWLHWCQAGTTSTQSISPVQMLSEKFLKSRSP